MSLEEIRIQCLEIAYQKDDTPEQTIERAAKYYNFVTGQKSNTLVFEKTLNERKE